MRRVAIVQARMGSSRLPGKVLTDLGGRPMLARQLDRLRQSTRLDDLMIATSTSPADDALVALARAEGVRWFRGSETDVLARYAGAAREASADLVIRLTADCPLIDPEVVDAVVAAAETRSHEVDYVSNVLRRTYPRGLDTEALFADVLARVDRLATAPHHREHVTKFILERPERFATFAVVDDEDNSDLRWTVDTPEDLAMVRRIDTELTLAASPKAYREILAHVRRHPDIAAMNAGVEQKG